MTHLRPFKCKQGFSLIEAMVVLAIVSVLVLEITSLMKNMFNERRALSEKLASLTLQSELNQVVTSPTLCSQMVVNFGNPTFDSSDLANARVTFSELKLAPGTPPLVKVGDLVAPIASNSLVIKQIQLKDFSATGTPNNYKTNLVVGFASDSVVRALVPATVGLFVKTTGAGAVQTISDCLGAAVTGATVDFQNCYSIDADVPRGTSLTQTCNSGFRLVFASALRDGSGDKVTAANFSFSGDSITINADKDGWRMLGKCCKEM